MKYITNYSCFSNILNAVYTVKNKVHLMWIKTKISTVELWIIISKYCPTIDYYVLGLYQ